jgi:hypothetical protein
MEIGESMEYKLFDLIEKFVHHKLWDEKYVKVNQTINNTVNNKIRDGIDTNIIEIVWRSILINLQRR